MTEFSRGALSAHELLTDPKLFASTAATEPASQGKTYAMPAEKRRVAADAESTATSPCAVRTSQRGRQKGTNTEVSSVTRNSSLMRYSPCNPGPTAAQV